MKWVMGTAVVLLLLGTNAFGADWESQLPPGTPDRVRASAREAGRGGVDPNALATMTAKMEENRFGERLTIRAHEIVMAAHQERLPVEPIVSKAYEGIAKRVTAEQTVRAMEAVRSRYAAAFQNARSLTTDARQQQALGRAIAEGMAAGIQQRDLARVTENLQQQSRQLSAEQRHELALQSFQTVREMGRFGVPSNTVGNVVCQALQSHFSAQEMAQLRSAFAAEARYGNAVNIAQQYGAQIGRERGPEAWVRQAPGQAAMARAAPAVQEEAQEEAVVAAEAAAGKRNLSADLPRFG
jgi:transcriptional regulator NrdR family protein